MRLNLRKGLFDTHPIHKLSQCITQDMWKLYAKKLYSLED